MDAPRFLFQQISKFLQQENRHQHQGDDDQDGRPEHQFREMYPASVAGLEFFFEVDHGERNPFSHHMIRNVYTAQSAVGK
jgi:hypothetical protein